MVDYARILDETAQEYQGHKFIDWPMDTSWYDDFGKVSGEAAEFESNQDYGGFQKSLDLLQSMVGSYGMSVGKGLEDAGLDTVGKWLFSSSEEIYDKNIEAASQSQRKRYEETEGFGEKAEWFVETLKEQSLMTGVPIAVGFGGQALTKMLIAVPHPLVKAAGFMGAAALASYVLQTGEAYSSQMQKGGRVDASAAHTAGIIAALLDVLTPAWLFGKIPGLGNALKRNISEKILSGSNIGKKILTGAIASLSEGETERLQESLIEASVNYANDLPLFEFDEEQRANIREAVYAGRAMGGTIGTLAPRGTTGAPVSDEAIDEVTTPETTPETTPTTPTTPETFPRFDADVDYDISPGRRGVPRATPVASPEVEELRELLNQRREQLDKADPGVSPASIPEGGSGLPPIRVGRSGIAIPERRRVLGGVRTPRDLSRLSMPASRQQRVFPPKVPPINKSIPDGTPALDLNTGVDERVGILYDTGTRRPLGRKQRAQAQKDADDLVARQRKETSDIRKEESEVRKDTSSREKEKVISESGQAEIEGASDFSVFLDEAAGDTNQKINSSYSRMVNKAREIR